MDQLFGVNQATRHSDKSHHFLNLRTHQINTNHARSYLWGIICLVSYQNLESYNVVQMGAF